MLTFQNVTYSYGSSKILHGITGEISPGATVLLGANGAGKSTLLMLMASVRRPDSGTISVAGVGDSATAGIRLRAYRSAVSWLPQKFAPFPGLNVQEHVAYAGWLKGMTRSDAWDAAQSALIQVDLQTKAQMRVSRLSGGQQRRVAIAGALVHDAQVLLLDEPTAGLDPAQRQKFRDILSRIAVGRVVIVSSHDTDDAHSSFENVLVLREGALVFQDNFHAFLGSVPMAGDVRDQVQAAYLKWAGDEE